MATKKDTFKDAFEELETIVQRFESGDLDLDESLKQFERGLELAEYCKKQLAVVENKVKEIKGKFKDSEGGDN
ncbi:MAG: exodeoxyribonuclease VII small subunit [Patescibacteria group bacterium]